MSDAVAPTLSTDEHNKKTSQELDDALVLLDHELEQLKLDKPLQIRAIGGYALMKHGIRDDERAYTVDIDTVTKDYSAAVVQAIETVARRAGLDDDWLNNYNVMDNDPEQVEDMLDAQWISQDTEMKNIDLSIATIPTLTRSKIIAADNAEFSGRTQDVPDLLNLLEHQGITSFQQFRSAYPDPFNEYPETAKVISDRLAGKSQTSRLDQLKAQLSARVDDLDFGDEDSNYDYDTNRRDSDDFSW